MSASAQGRVAAAVAVAAVVAGSGLTAWGLGGMANAWHREPLLPWVGSLFALLFVSSATVGRRRGLGVTPLALAVSGIAAAVAGALGPVLAVATVVFAAACAGRLALRRWRDAASDLEAVLVGIVLLGIALDLGGLLPVHYPWTYAALLGAPLALGFRHGRDALARAWRRFGDAPAGAGERAVHCALAAVLLVHAFVALMPERGFDALAMHLYVPEHVVWHHRWSFDVDRHVWAVMPMLVDWVYTLSCMLGGETAARLTNLAAFLLVLQLVRGLARWAGCGELAAAVAALVLATTPLALTETSCLFVDALWSAFVLGGALAVLRAATADGGAAKDLVVAGVLLGGALAAKAVTFMVMPALGVALLVGCRRWWRGGLAALAGGAAAGAAIGCVPYARAWILTGNPVFPFFNGVFKSSHYPAANFEAPNIFDKGMTWDVLYRLTFDSSRFLESLPGAGGFQWLLFVGPACAVLVLQRRHRGLALLAIAGAAAWLTFQQTAYLRYVLPSYALAAAGAAVLLAGANRAVATAGWLGASAAVALNLGFFSRTLFLAELEPRAVLSEAGRADFLASRPHRLAVDLLNGVGPPGNPVAFLTKPFAAGLHPQPLFDNWYNSAFAAELGAARSPDELGALFARHHVSYVLFDDAWRTPAERGRVEAITREVRRFGPVAVREVDARFRCAQELVREPAFGDAIPWLCVGGASIGDGAVLPAGGGVQQQVAVAGGREHRLAAEVARLDAGATAIARVLWLDGRGRTLASDDLRLSTAGGAADEVLVAPARAVQAIVLATADGGAAVVHRLSLRH
ncbi:MAG: hypothetical protein U1E73_14210 [Planctomycetota bacterium]